MKEIKNVKEQVFFTYEAIDGTVFNSKEECKNYESTCKCVLMAKYNQIPKVSCPEYDITNYLGSEEYMFDIIKLRNDNDIDIIIQLFKLKYGNSYQDEIFNSVYTTLQKHKKLGSHILIERGIEYEGFYLSSSIRTLEEIISNINSMINNLESTISIKNSIEEKNEDENNN
jgi:hypothetical protein